MSRTSGAVKKVASRWRQAALLEFERVFPGAQVLKLETNYRSSRTIVERADAFIRRNQNRQSMRRLRRR